MRSLLVEVSRTGTQIDILLHPGTETADAVLVVPDNVEVRVSTQGQAAVDYDALTARPSGFPSRALIEETIVQILREHGGHVSIRDERSGWNMYDEVAARLGVSIEARTRPTPGTGEPAWRPEVGYARKNLEQRGIITPTEESGRGVWKLRESAA